MWREDIHTNFFFSTDLAALSLGLENLGCGRGLAPLGVNFKQGAQGISQPEGVGTLGLQGQSSACESFS